MKTQHSNTQTKKVANLAIYLTNPSKIDEAIRRFKKKVEKYEILDIYKEKQFYSKPSDIKHRQKNKKKK
jgi:ribosomal protein S21